jgi:hypothetical protein
MTNPTLFEVTHHALVGRLKRTVAFSKATLQATPDDMLDYKPTGTAKSVRELAQHMIEGNNLSLQACKVDIQGDTSVSTVSDLVAELDKTGTALVEFAASCDEGALVGTLEFFGHPFTTVQMLMTAEWHLSRHGGQIDYLQTTWNDLEDRF